MTSSTSAVSLYVLIAALGPCAEPAATPSGATPASQVAPPPAAATPKRAPEASSTVERPPAPPQQQTQTTHTFMRDHANEAMEIRRAVIAGRFDLLHRAAAVIASDAWSPQLRPEYQPHVAAVRKAANAALDARSVQSAAAALGELGDACASCHREHGGPAQPAPGADVNSAVGAMAVHAAAEQAMWEGLYTPSDARWALGAERLGRAPELTSDIEEVAALARQLQDRALEAAAKKPNGGAYASVLATCSTCHRRLAIEPH